MGSMDHTDTRLRYQLLGKNKIILVPLLWKIFRFERPHESMVTFYKFNFICAYTLVD